MKNGHVINNSVLEIKGVPTSLILFAIQKWEYCGKYAKRTTIGNNVNQFIKAISVWLILKNETTSGCIHNYRQQLQQLAEKNKMSVRTLEKHINWLRNEGLAYVSPSGAGGNLVLHQYGVLRKYDIDIKERESTIFYDTQNKTRLHEILISIAIQRLKDKRCIMYWKKINQNPDEHTALCDLLVKFGADRTRLNDIQYFRECHLELICQSFEEEEPGQEVYQFLHKIIKANPDLNAKAATYGRRFGYTIQERKNERTKKDESMCQSFSHLKRRLVKKGLISAEKDNIEGWNRARKDEKVFHHRWLKEFGHTIWFRVDQLTVHLHQFFKMQSHEKAAA